MTHLHEHRFLKCPYTRAKGYLEDSLQELAQDHSETRLTLLVPLHEALGEAALRKDVTVTYAMGHDPMHFDQPWKIRWTPVSGPYPEFDGELTVRADEDYRTAILELTGQYTPPMGLAGIVFDAIAGVRIARATAQQLLKSFGAGMEAQFIAEEKAKRPGTAMNILIVEHDEDRAAELVQWLEDGGFSTNVAATQEEALRLLADHPVQMVILSEHPAIDAAAVLKSAARIERIPAIILGNENSSKSRVDALALGADYYLPKPHSLGEVLARARVLARSRAPAS